MQIRFADRRPDGDLAVVVPVAGTDGNKLLSEFGGSDTAFRRQRFEGEAGSAAEHFHDGRRVLAVGTGTGKAGDAAE